MHWYGGSIADAVTLSKIKNAIFVVFVEDNNEQSIEMATTIDHEAVVHRLANPDHFLAIKLKSGSVNYTHFAQIYQFVPVPSLFFIGRNGTPLEVVCAGVQPDNLAQRIDRILAEHYKEKPLTVQPSTSSESVKAQTANLLQAEAASAEPVAPPKVDSASTKVDTASPKVDTASPKVDTASPKVDTASPKVNTAPPEVDSVPQKVAPATPKVDIALEKDVNVPQKDVSAQKADSAKRDNTEQKEPETSAPPAKIQKTSPSKEYDIVCDGDVCVRRPRNTEPGASTSGQSASAPARTSEPKPMPVEECSSDVSVEDKVDRAKELIEARRREKAEKEKELAKQKELERRNLGQGVAELKRWQTEQELKHLQEERKREKMENDLARQRILEQIAQDRAERKARDVQPAVAPPPPQHHTSAPPATSGDAHSHARIQFKLPNGNSHTASFSAGETLSAVQRYVADNFQLSASNFALWTAFPRRELTETDSTLRELQLAPSAALLVLPRRTGAQPPQAHSSFSVITFITQLLTSLIYEPSLQIYNWLRMRLFPPPAVTPRATTPARPLDPTNRPPPSPLRRRGNIHRLPGDAPDDDNNTWNGNSTQQM